jgi:tetratricopeptide (TPR) repeat protein
MSVANYHLASKAGKREQQQPLFDKAIKYAKQALELYPDYLDSNCILSGVYFALKDHEQCLKYATKYLAACEMLKKDKSKALVIPLLTLSQEWQVCLQLAINFFEQADADKAIALIARGEALLPKELKYKLTWGVFKYMIMLGDPISLKNAESIYMVGFKSE